MLFAKFQNQPNDLNGESAHGYILKRNKAQKEACAAIHAPFAGLYAQIAASNELCEPILIMENMDSKFEQINL